MKRIIYIILLFITFYQLNGQVYTRCYAPDEKTRS